MAIRDVVTNGFGNGTFDGSIALVVTRGFGIGEAVVTVEQFFPLPNVRKSIEVALSSILSMCGCRNVQERDLPPLLTVQAVFAELEVPQEHTQSIYEGWFISRPEFRIVSPGGVSRYIEPHTVNIQSVVWHYDIPTSRRYVQGQTEKVLRTLEKNKSLSFPIGKGEITGLEGSFSIEPFGEGIFHKSLITFDLNVEQIEARGRVIS